jgi:hypothetical protein
MSPRIYRIGNDELNRVVGQLSAHVDNLVDDVRAILVKLEQNAAENQSILRKIDKLENKLDPLPVAIEKHEKRIDDLEEYNTKMMAVASLVGLVVSGLGVGLWELVIHFSAVIDFIRKIFGASP